MVDYCGQIRFCVRPGGRLTGRVRVPGDKSISHRTVILGAIAEGATRVKGFLRAQDCLATAQAFRDMGVSIDEGQGNEVMIHGVGLHGLKVPPSVLDVGNSGTAMRLLAGLLCGQPFNTTLTGDVSLMRRPMRRIAEPLTRMGASIRTSAQGTPPLRIQGRRRLHGIEYRMPVASAQVKSSVLLAGLYAVGETRIVEQVATRDHTERMLAGFGYPIEWRDGKACLRGRERLRPTTIEVPADISSAAFFMVGASIAPGSDLILEHVGVNPTRSGVIEILRRMGASIETLNEQMMGREPVADLRVRYTPLRGIDIPRQLVPLAIDEFPAILVAAACARGTTVLTGAEELRIKESDRIEVMAAGLRACGIEVQPKPDGMIVHGGQLQGASIDSRGDHRAAMAFAMAGLAASSDIIVEDCDNVATSFPGFAELAETTGLHIAASKLPSCPSPKAR
jgi:3-phosphoshikimate 1-carboxyvinyltransferase